MKHINVSRKGVNLTPDSARVLIAARSPLVINEHRHGHCGFVYGGYSVCFHEHPAEDGKRAGRSARRHGAILVGLDGTDRRRGVVDRRCRSQRRSTDRDTSMMGERVA